MTAETAWRRLAELLIARRVKIAGHTNRAKFARERGILDRTLFDIEKHRRTNFSAAQLAQIEQVYQWRVGSIQRVLDGGEPELEPTPVDQLDDMARAAGEDNVEDAYEAIDALPGTTAAQREAMKALLRGWRGAGQGQPEQRRRTAGEP